MNQEFEANVAGLKMQTASRRASSLSKNRAEFSKHTQVSAKGRKESAGPVGSDSSVPHRAARVATRTLLAKGCIAGTSDMPQVSMGCQGTWERWIRKPSVAKTANLDIEDLDLGSNMISYSGNHWQEAVCDDKGAAAWSNDIMEMPCPPFDVKLDDEVAFPALEHKEVAQAEVLSAELTPEKHFQVLLTKDKPAKEAVASQVEDDVAKDWVVVPSSDASKIPKSTTTSGIFDAQHPRNTFAKKSASKAVTSKDDLADCDHGIDWSKAGMPIELISRLIRGSTNSAHLGIHSQSNVSTLPAHVIRAQNIGSSKRQTSTPKTPPRSQSKPRAARR